MTPPKEHKEQLKHQLLAFYAERHHAQASDDEAAQKRYMDRVFQMISEGNL